MRRGGFASWHQALDRLNPTFCELYAAEGRLSVPPEQLLLASLLQAFYGIRAQANRRDTARGAEHQPPWWLRPRWQHHTAQGLRPIDQRPPRHRKGGCCFWPARDRLQPDPPGQPAQSRGDGAGMNSGLPRGVTRREGSGSARGQNPPNGSPEPLTSCISTPKELLPALRGEGAGSQSGYQRTLRQ